MFKRPIIIVSISYILGIIWGIYVKNIFLFFVMQILILIIFMMIYYTKKNRITRLIRSKCSINICIIFIVFSILGLMNLNYKESKFECIYSEKYLKATVISDVIIEEYSNKYIARLDKYNIKVYLVVDKKTKLEYGDLVEIKDSIEKPQGQRNSYGFDYKQYLRSINIAGTAIIDDYKLLRKNNVSFFERSIYNTKENIKDKIYKMIETDNRYILEAFILGDKDNISDEINSSFRNSNLTHLLAISGTHIAIIITLLNRILRFSKIGKRKSYYICVFLLYIYIFIAGEAPSVTRACSTTILSFIAKLIHRKSDIYSNLGLSAFYILTINPFNIINLGFILSYGGIFGIIFYNAIYKEKSKNKLISYIKNSFLISICVQIIIFPVLINSFNKLSLIFFISNLLASPLLALIINLGLIAIVLSYIYFPLSHMIGILLNILLDLLIFIANLCETLPFSENHCVRIDILVILLYYCFIIYALHLVRINRLHIIKHFLKKNCLKIISISLITIIVLNIYNSIGIKDLKIKFIDVGQGDSTLIITPCNKKILIDGGGESINSGFKVGERTLLPYLLNNKIKVIDYILISHFDSDHVRWNPLYIRRN